MWSISASASGEGKVTHKHLKTAGKDKQATLMFWGVQERRGGILDFAWSLDEFLPYLLILAVRFLFFIFTYYSCI